MYQLSFPTYLNETGKRSSYSRNAQSIVKGRRHIWDEEPSQTRSTLEAAAVAHKSGISLLEDDVD